MAQMKPAISRAIAVVTTTFGLPPAARRRQRPHMIKATPRMAWIAVATGAIDQVGMSSMICRVNRAGVNVILQHDLLARVIKAHRRQPASIGLCPGSNAGIDLSVS
jgi:hypothetical protein